MGSTSSMENDGRCFYKDIPDVKAAKKILISHAVSKIHQSKCQAGVKLTDDLRDADLRIEIKSKNFNFVMDITNTNSTAVSFTKKRDYCCSCVNNKPNTELQKKTEKTLQCLQKLPGKNTSKLKYNKLVKDSQRCDIAPFDEPSGIRSREQRWKLKNPVEHKRGRKGVSYINGNCNAVEGDGPMIASIKKINKEPQAGGGGNELKARSEECLKNCEISERYKQSIALPSSRASWEDLMLKLNNKDYKTQNNLVEQRKENHVIPPKESEFKAAKAEEKMGICKNQSHKNLLSVKTGTRWKARSEEETNIYARSKKATPEVNSLLNRASLNKSKFKLITNTYREPKRRVGGSDASKMIKPKENDFNASINKDEMKMQHEKIDKDISFVKSAVQLKVCSEEKRKNCLSSEQNEAKKTKDVLSGYSTRSSSSHPSSKTNKVSYKEVYSVVRDTGIQQLANPIKKDPKKREFSKKEKRMREQLPVGSGNQFKASSEQKLDCCTDSGIRKTKETISLAQSSPFLPMK